MKKLISIALVALMAAGSAIAANAEDTKMIKPHKGVDILWPVMKTKDNTVNIYTSNLSGAQTGGFQLVENGSGRTKIYLFKDYTEEPKTITYPSDKTYDIWKCISNCIEGSTKVDFSKTGGDYIKVKARLSEIIPNYFNDDGTRTQNGHTYNFTYQNVDDGYYDSVLFFQSGGVITGAAPDSLGYVTFYISANVDTNPYKKVRYYTGYGHVTSSSFGKDKGVNGTLIKEFMFGNLNFDYSVDINDVSLLQQYLAGSVEFDKLQMFFSDVNRDYKTDVKDVTSFQQAISK